MVEIILASKSKVRKKILDENNINNRVEPSNVDEDLIKESLLKDKATPTASTWSLSLTLLTFIKSPRPVNVFEDPPAVQVKSP